MATIRPSLAFAAEGGLMEISVRRSDPLDVACDALVVPLLKSDRVPRVLRALDTALDGLIGNYLAAGDLSGKAEEVLSVPTRGMDAARVIFVGLGPDTYSVSEEMQSGWEQTYPIAGAYVVTLGEDEIRGP